MRSIRGFVQRLAIVALAFGGLSAVSAPTNAVAVTAAPSGLIINQVAFEGNSKLKGTEIIDFLESKSRGKFDAAVAQADAQRIMDVYKRNGRSAASVTYRLVNLPNGRVDIVFTIKEGDKTGIKSINFAGNEAYSSSKLRGLMSSTEMNWLSFFKTSDVYDAEKIASDSEAIRRYYLKNGYTDFQITKTSATYDPAQQGWVVTIGVNEGPQYRISALNIDSRLPNVTREALASQIGLSVGDVYNGDALEKSVERMARVAARAGYAFAQIHPRGDRNTASRTVALTFIVDDGPRVYVERINIKGNTRTRDYVIRREFDIGEGDPYNRVLVDRAERRLNNLGFFKTVRITNAPGSSPDRVVINVDVEDQATGSFGFAGGYSTADGIIGEVSVTETNFLGRGQYLKLALSGGSNSKGIELNFTEPNIGDQRMSAGFDLFRKQTDASKYAFYQNWVTGGTLRAGLPITDELTLFGRYSLYASTVKIPNTKSQPYDDCTTPIVGFTNGTTGGTSNCMDNNEASLAIKELRGTKITSLLGYTLQYDTLDNRKNPTNGIYAEFKQDLAGVGGNSRFLRTTADVRYYHEFYDDIVGFVRGQAGHIMGYGHEKLRMTDNFNLGAELVRGFAPGGIGARDITNLNNLSANGLGGTTYFGGTAEVQFPLFGLPKEVGMKGALFADAGTLFGYKGYTNFNAGHTGACVAQSANAQGTCITVFDDRKIRSSVGVSLLWASPLGPIRFDYAFVLSKGKYDQKQAFRFSGGTSF